MKLKTNQFLKRKLEKYQNQPMLIFKTCDPNHEPKINSIKDKP